MHSLYVLYRFRPSICVNDNLVALAGTIWRNFDVYESKEVRDLFDVKYGKTMPKTQLTSTGVPVFGANGMIGYTDKPVMLPDYSVVITSRGSGSGDVQLMDKGVFVTNNLLTIESKHPQSNWATWQMLEQANIQGAVTGSAQPQLTIENFARVVVNIPDKDTIQKFNEVSENFEQIYWANKNEIKLLTETRDTLLRKLIG
nr:restriction endonuclease subunit S [Weissella confusa]